MNQTKEALFDSHVVRQPQKTFDSYNFAGYEWFVLDIDAEAKKALLLSKHVLEEKMYHHVLESVTWETSSIRSYLNGKFYNNFSKTDKARIIETQVINNDNPWFMTGGGNDTTDKVFLLSIDEVVKYFGDSKQLADENHPDNEWWGFSDRYNEARATVDTTGHNRCWWLRTPGYYSFWATLVNSNGELYIYGFCVFDIYRGGVRPAMWVSLESCYECDTYDSGNLSDAINAINNDGENVKVCSSCLDTEYLLCEDCNKYNHVSRITDAINADYHHVQVCDDCLGKAYRDCVACGWNYRVDDEDDEDFSDTQSEFLCHYCAENIE